MNYPLFELHTHRSHPIQSYVAAEKVDVPKACKFALEMFQKYPGLTRNELADRIGFKASERVSKRAKDLEGMGLLKRTKDTPQSEYRNWPV